MKQGRIQKKIHINAVNWFLTKVQRQLNGKGIVFPMHVARNWLFTSRKRRRSESKGEHPNIYFTLCTKFNSTWNIELSYRKKLIKILEYNVPQNICELEFCKHFLDTAAKAWSIFIRLKYFAFQKTLFREGKEKSQSREIIFKAYI